MLEEIEMDTDDYHLSCLWEKGAPVCKRSSCFCDFNWRKASPCKTTNSSLLLENCCLNTTPDLSLSAAKGLSPSPGTGHELLIQELPFTLRWPLSVGFTFFSCEHSSAFPPWPEGRQPKAAARLVVLVTRYSLLRTMRFGSGQMSC